MSKLATALEELAMFGQNAAELEPESIAPNDLIASPNARFAAFEAAFRTLKLAMESNRDRIEEGRFFRLELLARRNRRDAAVPRWERWASWLYEVSSDYGNSIARPLVWIAASLVIMGVSGTKIAALASRCAPKRP